MTWFKRVVAIPIKNLAKKIRPRFWLALAVLVLALFLQIRESGTRSALAPVDVLTARITAAILDLTGMPVYRDAAVLSHPAGFNYKIYYKCTGLVLVLFLTAALLALPGRRTTKVKNILSGALMVFALNFVRLASLFYIGVRHPQIFDFYHSVFWETAMLVFVLLFWLRAQQHPKAAGRSSRRDEPNPPRPSRHPS